jgi:biotin--protein ligase
MFSTVIWHPSALGFSAPVVFVQYLAAMAVVQAVTQYARGYDRLRGRLRLKWPNDIYADSSNVTASESSSSSSASGGGGKNQKGVDSYVKIGGVLVNSSYSGDSYGLVVGVGMNVANAAPTTGLDALAAQCGLPAFQRETLLAKILAAFEDLYNIFCVEGWGRKLEDIYYGMWLHE